MIDALEPAYEAIEKEIAAGQEAGAALAAGVAAAEAGVEYTKGIIARKGRASYLGERSIGHQDPGATSSYLILKTMAEFLSGRK
jgi:dihydroxyacetone kinase-like protein